MTAIKGKDFARFLAQRPGDVPVILIYGQDAGMVRDHAQTLGKSVVDDLNDAFNAAELTEADLAEPGRLSDEATALSFMGGERLIRIRSGGVPVAKAVQLLLDGIAEDRIKPNAVTIVEAGDLKKSNALRKACEASKHAAALACYPESVRDLHGTIRGQLENEGLSIGDDALALMASQLGDDRGITRAATEMLALYMGPKGGAREKDHIEIDDVRACLVDSADDATFDVVDAALSGQPGALSQFLYRADAAAVSPLGILRITQNKLLRLLTAQSHIRQGDSAAGALKKVRPPVFFGEQRSFEVMLKCWPLPRLEAALVDVLNTDLAAKTTGAPQRELVERTLLRLAMQAERRR